MAGYRNGKETEPTLIGIIDNNEILVNSELINLGGSGHFCGLWNCETKRNDNKIKNVKGTTTIHTTDSHSVVFESTTCVSSALQPSAAQHYTRGKKGEMPW